MNKGGRPPLFTDPEDMQVLIDKYFSEECADKALRDAETGDLLMNKQGNPVVQPNPPTVDGLALYLGFSDRASFYDYEKKDKFTHTIKRARARIADYAQKQLFTGNSTGAIFWLKNHGWIDKSQTEHTGKDDSPIKFTLALGDKAVNKEED